MSSESRGGRRAAIARLDPTTAVALFELRDAIVMEADAEARAIALLRLDAAGARRLVPYVREATNDRSMQVREAAFVALARAGDAASLPRAVHACKSDRGFRVRRAALLFAARTCGAEAVPVLALASRDPFWRVRVAARRVGAAIDAAIDVTGGLDAGSAPAIAGIDDPDPAVVAARLARVRASIAPSELVGFLGHSHQALRRLAVNELAARGDAAALRDVTAWLEEERVPYGPAAAEAVLARSGERAAALASEIVRGDGAIEAGAIAWAIGAAHCVPAWSRHEAWLAHADPRVRRAAVSRVPEAAPTRSALLAAMVCAIADADVETRVLAATWLARTRSREAREVLRGIEPAAQPTVVRELLVELRREARDVDALRELARDEHGAVRASAVSALLTLSALSEAERRDLEHDPDPWVREAVLVPERARAAALDPSVRVRRAAVAAMRDPAERAAWAEHAATNEGDAWLRARAAGSLAAIDDESATRALLRMARDTDLGVRGAAIAVLEARVDGVRRLLDGGALAPEERIAAYTLVRLGGASGGFRESDPEALAHLALLDDVVEGRTPRTPAPARVTPRASHPHRRTLGKSGLLVHPFGLSGAHDLVFDDFALAHERGVDLFFREPTHRELTRFLRASRQQSTVVVAGTYHADAASIERDASRTLRALRRDAIDVFLAFWTRSIARIDEVLEPLLDLRRRGLVRAVGVSTHDRALACEAADRGLDVVMVRHSAAHRGAESAVLAHCLERGTGVITFSNLCYGRMLHRTPAALTAKVTAPDCYRYSIAQPGVAACIAAPRRRSELLEDLAVIDAPEMTLERQAELRAHGDHVYARSKAWSAETWSVAERPIARSTAVEDLSDWIDRPETMSALP